MRFALQEVHPVENRFKEFAIAFINRHAEQKFRWLSFIWIGLLYAAGIYFWGSFLNLTGTPLDFEDWGIINSPRLDFFSDALRTGNLPLHMMYEKIEGQTTPLHGVDRFLSIPDVITTPQTLLLSFLSVNQFVFVELLVHYTIGFLGLLWFRRKYGISLLAYGILFFLFSFNGYVQAHYGIGHITWSGYFLFPFFIALVIQVAEGRGNWAWVGKFSLLLFYMVLAGSQHHFTWLLIFLGVLALVCFDQARWIFLAGLFAGLLSAVRLLPPILILEHVFSGTGNRLLPGYPTPLDILRSMAILVSPADRSFIITSVRWLSFWEFDIFIGLAGTTFLLYFGVFLWIKEGHQYPALQKLFIPTVVLFVLTIGDTFALFRALRIPLLDSERVPSRMIGLVLAVVLVVVVVYFQKWLDESPLPKFVLLATGFLVFFLIAHDLWSHARLWNVEAVRDTFGPVQMMLSGTSVGNRPDRPYILVLLFGLFLSLATGIFLFFKIKGERQLE